MFIKNLIITLTSTALCLPLTALATPHKAGHTPSKKTEAKHTAQRTPQKSISKKQTVNHLKLASSHSKVKQPTTHKLAKSNQPQHKTIHLARKKSRVIATVTATSASNSAPRIIRTSQTFTSADLPSYSSDSSLPQVKSSSYLVVDQETGRAILERSPSIVLPIASITKLMTAMVVLDGRQSLSDTVSVAEEDVDTLKGSSSRVPVGATMTREEALRLALMSSENRAASLLARYYPGGKSAFVQAMNIKARMLGAVDSSFYDSTGLNPANVSTAYDLMKIVSAASHYPLIREFTTTSEYAMNFGSRTVQFHNTNGLVSSPDWEIGLSKTGYISEAGRCLVMQTWVQGRSLIMVLLDSNGKYTRTADAVRIKQWLETSGQGRLAGLDRRAFGS